MKLTWGSCLLTFALLGQPVFAQPAWFMEPIRNARMEYLLDQAPAALVMDTLRKRHPKVEFFTHPTMNGFYAKGSRSELLVLRRAVRTLDVLPEPPEPIVRGLVRREYFRVQDSESEYTRWLLLTLVPGIKIEQIPELQLFAVEGTLEAIGNVRDLLPYRCEHGESVLMDLRLLEISQSGQKKLGGTQPCGGPDVYKPSKDIRREFVNGIEIPVEIELK